MFMELLISIVNASNHTKCVSLSNKKCMTQLAVINLRTNDYSQEFNYYPFAVKLDRGVGLINTFYEWSKKVSVPNKTEDLNLSVFRKITRINESKRLIKQISGRYKCRFDENGDQWCNHDKYPC